jgi:hypothetical protein
MCDIYSSAIYDYYVTTFNRFIYVFNTRHLSPKVPLREGLPCHKCHV